MPRSQKLSHATTDAIVAATPALKGGKPARIRVHDPVLAKRVNEAKARETSIDISDITDEEFLADIERCTVRA